MSDLPDRIRALRLHLGLTRREMGDWLGVHHDTVWKWETRGRRPGADTLDWLHRAFAAVDAGEPIPVPPDRAARAGDTVDIVGDNEGADPDYVLHLKHLPPGELSHRVARYLQRIANQKESHEE